MPLSVDMPASVILEVTHTEPGVKGNTATNATKPATVETGARINVPLFINEGDKIKLMQKKALILSGERINIFKNQIQKELNNERISKQGFKHYRPRFYRK